MLPAIFGLSGESLTRDERAFFRAARPAGFILFARNCRSREQLRRLTGTLREVGGGPVPILVDQEGGRVARLKPPQWPPFPAPWRFAELYARAPISAIEATRANAQAIALLLAEVGIDVNGAPVLDLRREDAHDVIGDRALGSEPMQVAALGRAVLEGLKAGGVCGIVKHMPGHGRARADSHEALPVIDASAEELAIDLAPFRALRDAPMAMTAHLLYPAWDAERCATVSPTVIGQVIREEIGFDGLLMSDDLSMAALRGSLAERARAAIDAGCDLVLQGSGELADNQAVAAALDPIGEAALARLTRAREWPARGAAPQAYRELADKRDALLSLA